MSAPGTTGLHLSPLDAVHRRLGAKMGAFAGWDMPIEYQGTLSEHRAVRASVGVFDLSAIDGVLLFSVLAANWSPERLTP